MVVLEAFFYCGKRLFQKQFFFIFRATFLKVYFVYFENGIPESTILTYGRTISEAKITIWNQKYILYLSKRSF